MGVDCSSNSRIYSLGETTIVYFAGNNIVIYNWELKKQKFLQCTDISRGAIKCTAISPSTQSGQVFLSYTLELNSSIIYIVELNSLKHYRSITIPNSTISFTALAFSEGAHYLAALGNTDSQLFIFDASSGSLITSQKVSENLYNTNVNFVSFHPYDENMICCTGKGVYKLIERNNKEFDYKETPQLDQYNIKEHIFAGTDNCVIVSTVDGHLFNLDSPDTPMQIQLKNNSNEPITNLTPTLKGFVCITGGNTIHFFENQSDSKNFNEINSVVVDENSTIISLTISPGGDNLVVLMNDARLIALKLDKTKSNLNPNKEFITILPSHNIGSIVDMDTASRKQLLVTCGEDQSIRVLNYDKMYYEVVHYCNDTPLLVSFHPNGNLILVSFPEKISIFGVSGNDLIVQQELNIKGCTNLRFSHSGQHFAVAVQNTVSVYSSNSFKLSITIKSQGQKISSFSWSTDDSHLITCDVSGQIGIWVVRSGKSRTPPALQQINHFISIVATDPTCTRCYGITSPDFTLRETEETQTKNLLDLKENTNQLLMGPSNRCLFVSTGNGSIRTYYFQANQVFPSSDSYNEIKICRTPVTRIISSGDNQYLFATDEEGVITMLKVICPQTRVIRSKTANTGGVRTPRLYQTREIKQSYIQPSNSRNIQTLQSNGDLNQTSLLKTLYNSLIEIINKLLAHNNATISFRTGISAQVQENQRLFGAFLQQSIKQFNTSPVLQRGVKPGDVASGGLQQSAFPFLKSWKNFAKSLIDIQNSGPEAIRKTIDQNFTLISTALESVSQFITGKSTIHNSPSRNIIAMIKQNNLLLQESHAAVSNTSDLEQLKNCANKVKSFSRLLNDCFAQEISQFNLPNNEIVRIRQRTYTACCDIISSLKGAYLFEMDMGALLNNLDEFQDCLTIMLERLDLPTTYIYRRDIPQKNEEETREVVEFEEAEDINFSGFSTASLLAQYGLTNIQAIYGNGDRLTELLNLLGSLAKNTEDENENLKNKQVQIEQDDRDLQEYIHRESQNFMKKQKLLEQEITRLKSIIDTQEDEINQLRDRKNDNEYKQALRNVARKLGGVMKEEELNFPPDDDDDDQLISKVDALTVYVVERKCQKCIQHKREEEAMRKILSDIVYDDDMSFMDIIKHVNQKFIDKNEEIQKMEEEKQKLSEKIEHLMQAFREILKFYRRPIVDQDNIYNEAINAAMDFSNELQRQLDSLSKLKEEELNHFAENISTKFKHLVDINNPKGTPVQQAVQITDLALVEIEKDKKEKENANELLKDVIRRVSQFLKVEINNSQEDVIKNIIEAFDKWENPLKKPLFESETQNKFLITSIEVINNRFRGVSSAEEKKTQKMSPQNLVNQTIKMLEKFQDDVEKRITDLTVLQQKRQDFRICLEKVDHLAHKFIGLEDIDLSTLRDEELCDRCVTFVDKITSNQANPQFLSANELNEMFTSVYDLVPVTTRSDPRKYIPEVCAAFISLNNTIIALKPFASILNEIFTTFDCKFSSYIPGSEPAKNLRNQIMRLHSALSQIQPSKINSFVFLIVSRFITLLSSFLSALTAFSYSENDEQAKSFMYALQQENEKLNLQLKQRKTT
ncbi:hypothetical protein TVAG_317050 [Trichomonas vaginalis G3]|uniref:Uncharacterized protein n=1 Tax=Trichomonas vaginalis (strain ATCC PRA-98 / G3) TaxID=412133 RepID=A2F081_TRIV3|nr:cilia- and flagella-associated protein 57 family [Trichomonas vaginalis G3]EAY01716.1 hypothetical protein TVAG_317050 [Trichomonas vaginalis G3]KAI5489648.1 cilia- and flagella-associated protein 57 family [Trichomonas vaginalis G3]|eukprot:XP_001330412.1 hypothetical protein [Trichomonas vaginalis G3]